MKLYLVVLFILKCVSDLSSHNPQLIKADFRPVSALMDSLHP
jgi:hypothetical protein